MIPAKYAHCEVPVPVKHRRQVPFHPIVEVPPDISDRALQIRRLEAELERFVLREKDYLEFAIEAMAANIHYSTKLEGNKVPLQEVKRLTRQSFRGTLPGATNPGVQEIINHLIAWRNPHLGRPWTLDKVLALHNGLLGGAEPDALPGRLRTHDVEVTEGDKVAFIPAPHGHVKEEMEALLHWVNNLAPAYFPVVGATVLFHRFESIHPFVDGNGRVGRTLFHVYLQQEGLRHSHLCLIEPEVVADPELYYTLLTWTDHKDQYTELIDHFSDAILRSYRKAEEKFRRKDLISSELDEISKRLLVMAKREKGWFSIADAATWVDGRSEDTVRRRLNALVSMGALRSAGRTKAKRYHFADPFEPRLGQQTIAGPGG